MANKKSTNPDCRYLIRHIATPTEIAKVCGVNHRTVYKWIAGTDRPSLDVIYNIINHFIPIYNYPTLHHRVMEVPFNSSTHTVCVGQYTLESAKGYI